MCALFSISRQHIPTHYYAGIPLGQPRSCYRRRRRRLRDVHAEVASAIRRHCRRHDHDVDVMMLFLSAATAAGARMFVHDADDDYNSDDDTDALDSDCRQAIVQIATPTKLLLTSNSYTVEWQSRCDDGRLHVCTKNEEEEK